MRFFTQCCSFELDCRTELQFLFTLMFSRFSLAKSNDWQGCMCELCSRICGDSLPPVQLRASQISVLEFRTLENKPKITATHHSQRIQSPRELNSNVKPRTNLRDSDLAGLTWSPGTCIFNQPQPTLPKRM